MGQLSQADFNYGRCGLLSAHAFPMSLCVQLANPLQQLMKDALLDTPVSHFRHVRVYADNRAFILDTHPDWCSSTYHKGLHLLLPGYDYYPKETGHFFWRDNQAMLRTCSSLMAHAQNYINIETALTVHRKQNEYEDRFIFSTGDQPVSHFISHFMNSPENINHIINFYYSNSTHYVKKMEKETFIVSNLKKSENFDLPIMAINNYLSESLSREIALSYREYTCLLFAISGMTSNEIAKNFNLSARTIENTLQGTRLKLGCSSVGKIFALFCRTGVFRIFMQDYLDQINKKLIIDPDIKLSGKKNAATVAPF